MQPVHATSEGTEDKRIDAGWVSKVMIDKLVKAWVVPIEFDPVIVACIAYTEKVRGGPSNIGQFAVEFLASKFS